MWTVLLTAVTALVTWMAWSRLVLKEEQTYGLVDDLARAALLALHPTVLVCSIALEVAPWLRPVGRPQALLVPLPVALTGTFAGIAVMTLLHARRRTISSSPDGRSHSSPEPASVVWASWATVVLGLIAPILILRFHSDHYDRAVRVLRPALIASYVAPLFVGLLHWGLRSRFRPLTQLRVWAIAVLPLVLASALLLGTVIYLRRPMVILEPFLEAPLPASVRSLEVETCVRGNRWGLEHYEISFELADSDWDALATALGCNRHKYTRQATIHSPYHRGLERRDNRAVLTLHEVSPHW